LAKYSKEHTQAIFNIPINKAICHDTQLK